MMASAGRDSQPSMHAYIGHAHTRSHSHAARRRCLEELKRIGFQVRARRDLPLVHTYVLHTHIHTHSQTHTHTHTHTQVGTGVMVGVPWQTVAHMAGDLRFFKELGADMIGCVDVCGCVCVCMCVTERQFSERSCACYRLLSLRPPPHPIINHTYT